jgi:hypothetical protein
MSDGPEPSAPGNGSIKLLSHGRILTLMAVIAAAGGILGAAFISASFGAGVAVGGLLAFANYYWLKYSLRKVFAHAAETGDKPRWLGLKYIGRYFVLGSIVAVLYAANAVSIVGLILGMGSFGFAVVLEGIFRIFSGPDKQGID